MCERNVDHFTSDWFWTRNIKLFWWGWDDVVDEICDVDAFCFHLVENIFVFALFSLGRASHAGLTELSFGFFDTNLGWVETGSRVVEGHYILKEFLFVLIEIVLAVISLSELHVIKTVINR